MNDLPVNAIVESSLSLLQRQRSHVLLVFSDCNAGYEVEFLDWYRGVFRNAASGMRGVIRTQLYVQHEVDITRGEFPRLPFRYLSIHDLSLDGAQEAEALIDAVASMHRENVSAREPTAWLYYPVSERVGQSPSLSLSLLTIAFANAVPGRELEFREWYATRHIRHALNIPALVSGQCFERTQFQGRGASELTFNTIAIYEQSGTPESIIKSFDALPENLFHFPSLDTSRFSEWVYRPI